MQGAATCLAARGGDPGLIVVGQGVGHVGDVPVSADRALFYSVAGRNAAGLHGGGLILVLPLGGVQLFQQAGMCQLLNKPVFDIEQLMAIELFIKGCLLYTSKIK